MSKPVALTDNQMTAIMRAAEPLQPVDRGPFLERVAARLQAIEIGDGSVGRVCRELQRDYLRPSVDQHIGKYGRRVQRAR